MEIRFAANRNLRTLAKWLRVLGYDTHYDREIADMDFYEIIILDSRLL
jgi:uncharacterized protein with PIN domain